MENQKNNKGVIVLLIILVVILSVLCVLFATGTISFKNNEVENTNQKVDGTNNEEVNQQNDNNLLDSNIIVSKNGKVISNAIPADLVGKYINKNSDDSYIYLSNGNIEVSEPTGGGITKVFKNDQVKLYINYLNDDLNSMHYITIEFYIEKDNEGIKHNYTYIGEKSLHDNKYQFKTPNPTPAGGEGQNDYPYKKQ